MKWFIVGVITLIIFCTGCIEICDVDTSQADQTHIVKVSTMTSDSCNISVNGVVKTYPLPEADNNIQLEGLNNGVNNVTITVGSYVKQFDVRVNNTQPTQIPYDSYNSNYWKTRIEAVAHGNPAK